MKRRSNIFCRLLSLIGIWALVSCGSAQPAVQDDESTQKLTARHLPDGGENPPPDIDDTAPPVSKETKSVPRKRKCDKGYVWTGKRCMRKCSAGYAWGGSIYCIGVADHDQVLFTPPTVQDKKAVAAKSVPSKPIHGKSLIDYLSSHKPSQEKRVEYFGAPDPPNAPQYLPEAVMGNWPSRKETAGIDVDIEQTTKFSIRNVRDGLTRILFRLDRCVAGRDTLPYKGGPFEAKIEVNGEGRTERAKVNGGNIPREVVSCVENALKSVRIFPEPSCDPPSSDLHTIVLELHPGTVERSVILGSKESPSGEERRHPRVKVSASPVSDESSAEHRNAARLVETHIAPLLVCYEKTPKIHGELKYRLTVNSKGALSKVRYLHGSPKPALKFSDCVGESFFCLTFPKPKGGPFKLDVTISYSMVDEDAH